MKKVCVLIFVFIFLLSGCSPGHITKKVFDSQISITNVWNDISDMSHRCVLAHKENADVTINLTCHSNLATIDVSGEEYVSQENVIEDWVERFSAERSDVIVEMSEICRGKTAPMIHVKITYTADGKGYVHDRYVYVYKNREYSLSGAWPKDASEEQIREAEQVIKSLMMN